LSFYPNEEFIMSKTLSNKLPFGSYLNASLLWTFSNNIVP